MFCLDKVGRCVLASSTEWCFVQTVGGGVSASSSEWCFVQTELAEVCQHSERYIGTEGGGMDQAISFLAQPGTVSLSV